MLCVKSNFHRGVNKIFNILRCYAAWVVFSCRRYGKIYPFHFKFQAVLVQSWTACPLRMEPIDCPEISVRNYRAMPRKVPKEHRSQPQIHAALHPRRTKMSIITVLLEHLYRYIWYILLDRRYTAMWCSVYIIQLTTELHVSTLQGHHDAYKIMVLTKAHAVILPTGSRGLQFQCTLKYSM